MRKRSKASFGGALAAVREMPDARFAATLGSQPDKEAQAQGHAAGACDRDG